MKRCQLTVGFVVVSLYAAIRKILYSLECMLANIGVRATFLFVVTFK